MFPVTAQKVTEVKILQMDPSFSYTNILALKQVLPFVAYNSKGFNNI